MSIILLIDDTSSDRDFITNRLEAIGYTVVALENAEHALDYLSQNSSTVDMILTDVLLPEMNGYQLLRNLRGQANTANIPIIVVSVKNQPNDVKWSFKMGATEFVAKPIDVDDLTNKIRRYLKN